jgi:hypothetical protein
VVKEAAELSLKILSQVLLGVELPDVLANSIRLVLDARAAATGKAVVLSNNHQLLEPASRAIPVNPG